MSIGKVIYYLLNNNATIASTTGSNIFPAVAAQDTALPYISYQQVSRTATKTKDRVDCMETYRIQIDIYGATLYATDALAVLVKSALNYQSGTIDSVKVDGISFEDENDFFDASPEIYRIQQDYMIRIKP